MRFLLALVGVLLAATASGMVAPMPLLTLLDGSELVVLGTVETIEDENGHRVATLLIDRTVKGKVAGPRLRFSAERTWACDGSDAVLNERALLFLTHDRERQARSDVFRITWSGRGRMPVEQSDGGDVVLLVFDDVLRPRNLPTLGEDRVQLSEMLRWIAERAKLAEVATTFRVREEPCKKCDTSELIRARIADDAVDCGVVHQRRACRDGGAARQCALASLNAGEPFVLRLEPDLGPYDALVGRRGGGVSLIRTKRNQQLSFCESQVVASECKSVNLQSGCISCDSEREELVCEETAGGVEHFGSAASTKDLFCSTHWIGPFEGCAVKAWPPGIFRPGTLGRDVICVNDEAARTPGMSCRLEAPDAGHSTDGGQAPVTE